MNKQIFGTYIAENRKQLGMTQAQLADRLHVTDKAVSKWERGLSYPDVTLLEPLAEALSVSIDALLRCRMPADEGKEQTMTEERNSEPIQTVMEISITVWIGSLFLSSVIVCSFPSSAGIRQRSRASMLTESASASGSSSVTSG